MTYIEWRDELEHFLHSLPQDERERALAYYGEMYADMRESGEDEEKIIESFGAPFDAAKKILDESRAAGAEKEKPAEDKKEESGGDRAKFVSEGPVDSLEINGALGKIQISFYDGDSVLIDYPATSLLEYKVGEQGGKITVTHKSVKFKNINMKGKFIPDMEIKVPAEIVPDLTVNLAGGHLKLDDGEYGNMKVYVEGGAVIAGEINCSDAHLQTDAGKIEISGLCCHRLNAEINAGKLNLGEVWGSEARFAVNAGYAKVDGADCKRTQVYVSAGRADIALAGAKEDYDAQVKKTLGSCNIENRSLSCDRSVQAEVMLGTANISFKQTK